MVRGTFSTIEQMQENGKTKNSLISQGVFVVGSVGVEPMTSTMSKPPFINKNNIKNGLFRCGYMKFQGMLEGLMGSQRVKSWSRGV